MTRQYKAMEERFMDDINKLENQIQSLKDELGAWTTVVGRIG